MTDYKALREAAEKAKTNRSVPAWDAFTDKTGPDDVLSLLDALAAAEAALKDIQQDLPYVMGFNAGFDHAMDETLMMEFPTMLRKMWSGGEVQSWLDEKKSAIRALKVNP